MDKLKSIQEMVEEIRPEMRPMNDEERAAWDEMMKKLVEEKGEPIDVKRITPEEFFKK